MGVQDLWSILAPVRECVPLYSLTGKTLAVDLSLWVCEAQHVQAMMGKVTKPHLRNLFFRVSSLTLMGVKLVFVMEGEAPNLKAETMRKRTDMRFGSLKKSAPKKHTTKTTSRRHFNAVLRECAEMLDYLGIPWVTAAGEAEAMCAFLDAQGLVDGCITNDGDAFLYGAKTIYRNFNMNTKDPQVDCYQTSRVEMELHLARETLVGLAILLGCDYIPKGIPGVGKEQALKLIKTLKGQTLLQRFKQWREEGVGALEGVVKKVLHCHLCRHPGTAKAHEHHGCGLCDSKQFCEPQDYDYKCPCDWHRYEQTRQASSIDAIIRKKTLASDQFPFTEIINEFLVDKDKPVLNFKRRKPNMLLMQKFAYDKMEWPKHYTSEKVLVLMTYTELMNRKHGRERSSQITPLRIWKPRVRNSIACFEIIWRKPDDYVFPEDHPEHSQEEVRTVEEQSLFRLAYPHIVELYFKKKAEALENKTNKKKPRGKKDQDSEPCDDGVSDLLAHMSLHSSTAKENQQGFASASAQTTKTIKPSHDPVLFLQGPESDKPQNYIDSCEEYPCFEGHLRAHKPEMVSSPFSTTSSNIPKAEASSPSVSMVMNALHLSDIDWESQSFTSSPPSQAADARIGPDSKSVQITGDCLLERITTSKAPFPECSPEEEFLGQCVTECSLRDRLLIRNTLKSANMVHNDVTTMKVLSQLPHLDSVDSKNCSPKLITVTNKSSSDTKGSKQPNMCGKKAPFGDKGQSMELASEAHLAQCSSEAVSGIATYTCSVLTQFGSFTSTQHGSVSSVQISSVTPIQIGPFKGTQTAEEHSASSTLPKRTLPEPGYTQHGCDVRNIRSHQKIKKSVCASVCSSSEDSDAENRHQGGTGHQRVKVKPRSRPKCQYFTSYSLNPTTTEKPAWNTAVAQFLRPKATDTTAQSNKPSAMSATVGKQQMQGNSVSSKGKCQNVLPFRVNDDIEFIPSPASPEIVSDGDDSETCCNSPLPLAERLRLKFLK